MARTLSGSLIGRAANTERRDLQEQINERRVAFQAVWWRTLEELQNTDPNWEAWFDAQPEQTCGEMLPKMIEHIKQIKAEISHDELLPALIDAGFGSAGPM